MNAARSTDEHWESWGARDPYFGVLTHPKFRSAALTPDAREEFFFSGRVHAEHVVNTLRQRVEPAFAPQRILDFGCGVGRVLIPFAALAPEAVGMDISPSMLAEAGRNCAERGVTNVQLLPSDDTLSALQGDFDLVHCCIVLQHIPVERGRQLFQHLLERIRPGGMGALQVTFAWDIHADRFGQPAPPPPRSRREAVRAWARRHFGRPVPPLAAGDPEMQMNFYNLSELMFLLQRARVERLYTELTDHGGALGAFMFFQKSHLPTV